MFVNAFACFLHYHKKHKGENMDSLIWIVVIAEIILCPFAIHAVADLAAERSGIGRCC